MTLTGQMKCSQKNLDQTTVCYHLWFKMNRMYWPWLDLITGMWPQQREEFLCALSFLMVIVDVTGNSWQIKLFACKRDWNILYNYCINARYPETQFTLYFCSPPGFVDGTQIHVHSYWFHVLLAGCQFIESNSRNWKKATDKRTKLEEQSWQLEIDAQRG